MLNPSMLAGLRVLVVDDEFLAASEVERLVYKLDCVVVGTAASVNGALDLVADEPPDLALLDVDLNGTPVTPLVETLKTRKVPYVLITGYSPPGVGRGWAVGRARGLQAARRSTAYEGHSAGTTGELKRRPAPACKKPRRSGAKNGRKRCSRVQNESSEPWFHHSVRKSPRLG